MGEDSAVIITGVSGSGKSTISSLLAERLGWVYADADDFHSADNITKLARGEALTDADRRPWLTSITVWLDQRHREGTSVVLACSALKRSYRDRLREGRPQVRMVFLRGDREVIAARLATRRSHFMDAQLLDSQFHDLDEPAPDEQMLTVDITGTPDDEIRPIIAWLENARRSG